MPCPSGELRHAGVPSSPGPGRTARDEVTVALGRAAGRGGEHRRDYGQLDQPVERIERLVHGDMFLGLRGGKIGQGEVGGAHGADSLIVRVCVSGAPRPNAPI